MAARAIIKPFVAVSAMANKAAQKRLVTMHDDDPLKQHIAAADASGDDLTAAVWDEYWTTSCALCDYRSERFFDEVRAFRSAEVWSVATMNVATVATITRACIRLVLAFMLGIMLGRNSCLPLMSAGSPLLAGVENPNMLQPYEA